MPGNLVPYIFRLIIHFRGIRTRLKALSSRRVGFSHLGDEFKSGLPLINLQATVLGIGRQMGLAGQPTGVEKMGAGTNMMTFLKTVLPAEDRPKSAVQVFTLQLLHSNTQTRSARARAG